MRTPKLQVDWLHCHSQSNSPPPKDGRSDIADSAIKNERSVIVNRVLRGFIEFKNKSPKSLVIKKH